MEALKDRLRNSKLLPSLPGNFTKLFNALGDESSGRSLIGKLIESDAALTIAVLRRANSVVYAGSEPVRSIFEAVSRLGFDEIKRIAVAHYCLLVADGGRGYGLDRESAWLGAYCGAHAAAAIARRTKRADPDVCYTAALLRDCGKLVMDLDFGEDAIQEALCDPTLAMRLPELERVCLGVDHAQAGQVLAEIWGLPDVLARAIGSHHGPVDDDPVNAVVHCADGIAMMLGLGVGTDGLRYEFDDRAFTLLGLRRFDIEDLCQSSVASCSEALDLLADGGMS